MASQPQDDGMEDIPLEVAENGVPQSQPHRSSVTSAEPRKVGCFVRHMVARPGLFCCSVLILAIVFSIIGPVTLVTNDEALFATENSYDLGDITAINSDAFQTARSDALGLGAEEEPDNEERAQQTQAGGRMFMVFEAAGDQVFTEPILKRIKAIEDKVTGDPDYPKYCRRTANVSSTACAPIKSPVNVFYASTAPDLTEEDYEVFEQSNFVAVAREFEVQAFNYGMHPSKESQIKAGMNAKFPNQAALVNDVSALMFKMLTISAGWDGKGPLQDIDKTLRMCQKMFLVATFQSRLDYYFSRTFPTTGISKPTRSLITFGLPLPGYKNADDRRSEQNDKMAEWFQESFREYMLDQEADTTDVDVLYFASALVFSEFQIIILVDVGLAFFSLLFVFLYLWLQTGSLFLSIVTVTEILLSMPMAYTFYHSILQFQYFSFLNAMGVYIVFAIGADDAFVFMDAYKQSMYEGPEVLKSLETRMDWVYRRAASAMFITSFTTMSAFVATSLSPLVEVASFGIYAAMLIFFDYVLVITLLPSATILWHNHMALKPNICCACCQKDGCSRLCSKQKTTETEEASTGVELATISNSTTEAVQPVADQEVEQAAPVPGRRVVKRRRVEVFFETKFSDFITSVKGRILVFVLFALWLIPVIYFATQVSAATRPDQIFPKNHKFQRIFDIMNDEFPVSDDTDLVNVYYVWGIAGMNRDGVNMLMDPTDLGKVQWDDTFSFDEAAQQHILDSCQLATQQSFMARNPDKPVDAAVECVMVDFKTWLNSTGNSFPAPAASSVQLFKQFTEATDPSTVSAQRPNVTAPYSRKWQGHYGFVDDKFRFIAFETQAPIADRGFTVEPELRRIYNEFEDFLTTVNKDAPASAGKAIQTTLPQQQPSKWVWMHTQSVFVRSALTGALFGVCLAFVVLLCATMNIVVALLSTVTIACILGTVLALMVMLGWELGTIESVNLTILAGFSVDYVVHLAHSYMESKSLDRRERVRHALATMGISVLAGVSTSVGASVFLFLTTLQFFAKFGGFLCMTVAISWLYSNFFFMAALATIGPHGNEKYFGLVCPKVEEADNTRQDSAA